MTTRPSSPCTGCGGNCAPECGRHPLGCFFGGPVGGSYWFADPECRLAHRGGDLPVLVGDVGSAYEHLRLSGQLVTSESGRG